MFQISGVSFPCCPRYPHQMDLHSRGWLTPSNTTSEVPLFFSWVNVAIYSFVSKLTVLLYLGCIFEKVPWSLVSRCYRMFLPTYSGAQAMKNNHYRLRQMQLQSNKKDAESYSFSLSPHVTPSLNIKHHISLLHSYDGYVWLLSWLHLELSNTQMIRHTSDGWHFFLIKSFDAGRPTSRLDLWGGKIHL